MFKVATRIFEITYMAYVIFVLGSSGLDDSSENVLALTAESSANEVFKDYCLHLEEGDTRLLLKKLAPVRLFCSIDLYLCFGTSTMLF